MIFVTKSGFYKQTGYKTRILPIFVNGGATKSSKEEQHGCKANALGHVGEKIIIQAILE